jgi:outer membrane protein OmpA-like peptidoglycan-associated protein
MLVCLVPEGAWADIESARSLWQTLQEEDAAALAPKRFGDAEKRMRELEKAIEDKDFEKQQEKLQKTEEALDVLQEAVLTMQTVFPEILQRRAQAESVDAATAAAAAWLDAEDRFRSIAEKMESGRREAAQRQAVSLADLYQQAFDQAQRFHLVGNTRRLLREAEDLDASQYTPRSYVRALDATNKVEKLLEELPADSPTVQDAARTAALKTRHMRWLLDRIRGVEEAETRPTLESEIVSWEDALARAMITLGLQPEFEGGLGVPLQQVQVEADRLVRERNRLRQQLHATLANLDSLHSEIQGLKGNVEEYEGMIALLRPYERDARVIERIQSRFTQGEGRVLVENRDVILRLHGLTFESGESEISDDNDALLAKVVQTIQELPDSYLIIEGHTDNSGRDQTNMTLSQARADAVRDYLVRAGIRPERITTVGYGAAKPVASNETPEGRRLNRRIEITISRI